MMSFKNAFISSAFLFCSVSFANDKIPACTTIPQISPVGTVCITTGLKSAGAIIQDNGKWVHYKDEKIELPSFTPSVMRRVQFEERYFDSRLGVPAEVSARISGWQDETTGVIWADFQHEQAEYAPRGYSKYVQEVCGRFNLDVPSKEDFINLEVHGLREILKDMNFSPGKGLAFSFVAKTQFVKKGWQNIGDRIINVEFLPNGTIYQSTDFTRESPTDKYSISHIRTIRCVKYTR